MTLLFPQNVYKNCFHKIFLKTWYVNGGETEGLCESTEWVVRRCSVKKMFWKISQNSQENTCAIFDKVAGLFFNKLYWKRDSGTGVFQWFLRNF